MSNRKTRKRGARIMYDLRAKNGPKTTQKLMEKAKPLKQKLCRLRAAVQSDDGYIKCFTCGSVHHWKVMHGGHFIAAGSSDFFKLSDENINPQCYICNVDLRGNHDVYREKMVQKYSEVIVSDMEAKKNTMIKRNRSELLELIGQMNQEIKRLEGEL